MKVKLLMLLVAGIFTVTGCTASSYAHDTYGFPDDNAFPLSVRDPNATSVLAQGFNLVPADITQSSVTFTFVEKDAKGLSPSDPSIDPCKLTLPRDRVELTKAATPDRGRGVWVFQSGIGFPPSGLCDFLRTRTEKVLLYRSPLLDGTFRNIPHDEVPR